MWVTRLVLAEPEGSILLVADIGESMERVVSHFPLSQTVFWNARKGNHFFKKWLPLSVCFTCLVFGLRRILTSSAIYEEEMKIKELNHDLEMDFERLLYYVQHPKTLCYTALSLGGNKDAKNRTDGDKIICQDQAAPLRPPCLVYSFGGNDEWSFEEEIVNFGCEVYTFDPSLKLGAHQHKTNIWFYPFGISHFNEDKFIHKEMKTWRMRTLDAIIEFLGHQDKTIDVLKMDIEGDEWNVIEDLLRKKLFKKVNHLCIEVHLHSGDWSRKLHILRKLEIEGQMRFFSSRKNLVSKPKSVPGLKNRTEQLFYELAWFRDS
ncbi:methyltransf_21 domain-containing protein [Caerostris darwini]|uniref:Methyltransf_21 domain-containing protein n=1 Tax=Caerostris darwini TaxID=1538125 RepID=A0AAV4PAH7_9ARAC|nr:methyltransf_21 domain-containing protein [Caerostris darwini]